MRTQAWMRRPLSLLQSGTLLLRLLPLRHLSSNERLRAKRRYEAISLLQHRSSASAADGALDTVSVATAAAAAQTPEHPFTQAERIFMTALTMVLERTDPLLLRVVGSTSPQYAVQSFDFLAWPRRGDADTLEALAALLAVFGCRTHCISERSTSGRYCPQDLFERVAVEFTI
jgi:hypothetical protein